MRGQRMLSAPSRFLEELSLSDRSPARRSHAARVAPDPVAKPGPRSGGAPRLERGERRLQPELGSQGATDTATPEFGPPAQSRELALEALELSKHTLAEVNPLAPPQPNPPQPTSRSAEDVARSQAALNRREAEALEAKRRRQSKLGGIPHLTTGASLLSGTNTANDGGGLRVGMSVRHPQLGVGEIIEASGEGKRQTVVVRFPDGSERSFLSQKAPLQPVGLR